MRSRWFRRAAVPLAALGSLAWTGVATANPATGAETDGPGIVAPSLRSVTGEVTVSVALSTPSVSDVRAQGGTPSAESAQRSAVRAEQGRVAAAVRALGASEVARVDTALNALVVDVDAGRLDAIAAVAGVRSVRPVNDYRTTAADAGRSGTLAQAIEYLGVTKRHAAGIDGRGVKVAVLDSGIDFTHYNLGGPGTVAFYESCYGDPADPTAPGPKDVAVSGACAQFFGPSAPKVKGGFDFVGEDWPNSPEAADPNPIDLEGHGTHVADIILGRSADGKHIGLAPAADLYALKVCSAVDSACSGVALLQAVDWAVTNRIDLMNLSLGSDYGQYEDDLTVALENAHRAGVLVVASAGNAGDRPFIVGSPSIGDGVISVAQTALPDDLAYIITVGATRIANTAFQAWSTPVTAPISGALQYGDGAGGNLTGCTPLPAGSATGKVVLVDRGVCNVSIKATNAAAGGAALAIIANNRSGAPPSFSFGGGDQPIPALSVSQPTGVQLRALAGQTASVSPADTQSLRNTTVGTSSRGPTIQGSLSKPEIGAPGAWLSAEVGTGDEDTNFGGTSGAAPTASGIAVLLLQKFPNEPPALIKGRLLNGADSSNKTPSDPSGALYATPISRVGTGEVRASDIAFGNVQMWADDGNGGTLSFGQPHVTDTLMVERVLKLRNNGPRERFYRIRPSFRDPADARTRAVSFDVPNVMWVPAGLTVNVVVRMYIDPARLPAWPYAYAAGGPDGGNGPKLDGPEFDGYITATAAGDTARVAWHVLPHRSADVLAKKVAEPLTPEYGPILKLINASATTNGSAEAFTLVAESPDDVPAAERGSNQPLIDLKAIGARTTATALQFAIVTHDRLGIMPYPNGFEVDLDTNGDGRDDYAIFPTENLGFGATGETVVVVLNLRTGAQSIVSFALGDFDSANVVYSVPKSVLGNPTGPIGVTVLAYDNYFTGNVTDVAQGTFAGELTIPGNSLSVPRGKTVPAEVSKVGTPATDKLLLLFADAAKNENAIVPVVFAP